MVEIKFELQRGHEVEQKKTHNRQKKVMTKAQIQLNVERTSKVRV
jgi:hypothetical protein